MKIDIDNVLRTIEVARTKLQLLAQDNPDATVLGAAIDQLDTTITALKAPGEADIEEKHTPAAPPPTELTPTASSDFTRIKNIDPELARRLQGAGLKTYDDIASLNAQNVAELSSSLSLAMTINRENWIEQAAILAKGNETRYAQRLPEPDPIAQSTEAPEIANAEAATAAAAAVAAAAIASTPEQAIETITTAIADVPEETIEAVAQTVTETIADVPEETIEAVAETVTETIADVPEETIEAVAETVTEAIADVPEETIEAVAETVTETIAETAAHPVPVPAPAPVTTSTEPTTLPPAPNDEREATIEIKDRPDDQYAYPNSDEEPEEVVKRFMRALIGDDSVK